MPWLYRQSDMKPGTTINRLRVRLLANTAVALALVLPLTLVAQRAGSPGAVYDLGLRRELFVDTYLIDSLEGVRLKLQEPRPAGVALRYDGPTEDNYCFYTTVLQDGDIYRMYYRGRIAPREQASTNVHLERQTTCYAESCDGIHWTKPSLGLLDVNGSRDNNVILETHAPQFLPLHRRSSRRAPWGALQGKHRPVGGEAGAFLVECLKLPQVVDWIFTVPRSMVSYRPTRFGPSSGSW